MAMANPGEARDMDLDGLHSSKQQVFWKDNPLGYANEEEQEFDREMIISAGADDGFQHHEPMDLRGFISADSLYAQSPVILSVNVSPVKKHPEIEPAEFGCDAQSFQGMQYTGSTEATSNVELDSIIQCAMKVRSLQIVKLYCI